MMGKQLRLKRIIDERSGKTILLPLDHGMTLGPIAGLESIGHLLREWRSPYPNGVIMHKGQIHRHQHLIPKETAVLMHLSASVSFSPSREEKVLVGSVEEALKLGADGVSIHLNIGCENDRRMLIDAGIVANACREWGMPLLIMIYPQLQHGERTGRDEIDHIGHCIRICEEIGADIVKIPSPTGEPDRFLRAVENTEIPVLIAGGEQNGADRAFLDRLVVYCAAILRVSA